MSSFNYNHKWLVVLYHTYSCTVIQLKFPLGNNTYFPITEIKTRFKITQTMIMLKCNRNWSYTFHHQELSHELLPCISFLLISYSLCSIFENAILFLLSMTKRWISIFHLLKFILISYSLCSLQLQVSLHFYFFQLKVLNFIAFNFICFYI